jgi:alpha-amylase
MPAINGTMLQAFHWDTPADGSQWTEIGARAAELARAGFTALWLPPPSKSQGGASDVGYGSYDLFDLGEFDQKGTVRTKYGSRAQLEAAVGAARQAGLQVYVDAIFNHKGGADGTEAIMATPVSSDNRNVEIGPAREIDAWTRFTFPGRGTTYSAFQWRVQQFDAVDFDQRTGDRSIFRLADKRFETPVDPERGNFDYLMFDDIDMSRAEARDELVAWGNWILSVLAVDGFRFDAAKHIWFPFYVEWLDRVRGAAGRSLFAVGEYFTGNVATLRWFIDQTGRRLSLYDFPLHFNLRDLGRGSSNIDMRRVFDGTLVAQDPVLAVTFVDNHDTWQDARRDEAVAPWFRGHAYALILLRESGYPCVFWPDWFGGGGLPSLRPLLEVLLSARRDHAFGAQTDYFDDPNLVGWTRAGDTDHPLAMAVVLSIGGGGTKRMATGQPNAGFTDVTGNVVGTVTSGADGFGDFPCNDRSVSVWVQR